ncbi:MAG: cold shock domain-containing protein [Candidatus Thermoplasmatota archaeon]|nr:cold shock domain-containing protein [Candidatus Thermoplasmatota archaeon]
MKGEVKFFNDMKNFGFIQPDDDGDDLFVHRSDIDGNYLKEGDEVEFDSEEGERGPRAVSVKKID